MDGVELSRDWVALERFCGVGRMWSWMVVIRFRVMGCRRYVIVVLVVRYGGCSFVKA